MADQSETTEPLGMRVLIAASIFVVGFAAGAFAMFMAAPLSPDGLERARYADWNRCQEGYAMVFRNGSRPQCMPERVIGENLPYGK